jgi:hypothetical protein
MRETVPLHPVTGAAVTLIVPVGGAELTMISIDAHAVLLHVPSALTV